MEDYQKRVIEEKKELDSKIERLRAFMASDYFNNGIPSDEQKRMRRQELIMELYSEVLSDRMEHFV
uniref:Uncharacterized protein n=1 Tax=viral metagenome TaxID=1070528 RepID=A0A6M3KZ55_9ZZZZ